MDKRERVLACMNHLPVDRPPVGFWFHFREDQKLGQACVQAHLDYYNHVDVDMVKIRVSCNAFPYLRVFFQSSVVSFRAHAHIL